MLAGQRRLAELGSKQGGMPGYGLRRMLVSPNWQPRHGLAFGERKRLATDRVILVQGPPNEVQCVRNIYRMLVSVRLLYYGPLNKSSAVVRWRRDESQLRLLARVFGRLLCATLRLGAVHAQWGCQSLPSDPLS